MGTWMGAGRMGAGRMGGALPIVGRPDSRDRTPGR
jgi:hypothetical protein